MTAIAIERVFSPDPISVPGRHRRIILRTLRTSAFRSAGLFTLAFALANPGQTTAATFSSAILDAVDTGAVSIPELLGDTETTDLTRIVPEAAYPDGLGVMPTPGTRPGPRKLSNALNTPSLKGLDANPLSNLAVAYFQFIASHEIARSPTNLFEDISVPLGTNDPLRQTTGQTSFRQERSVATGGTAGTGPRTQQNDVTIAFDASTVYGSTQARETQLRTFTDGKLKTGTNGGLPIAPSGRPLAGDVRADENPTLQALHATFVREHNRIAEEIKAGCETCTDQEIFDGAKVLVANMQHKIFYDELMPIFIGTGDFDSVLPDPTLLANVEIAVNEFTAAAGRVGHTQVPDTILLKTPGMGAETSVPLRDCFFDRACLGDATDTEILLGAAHQAAEPIDAVVVDALRNGQRFGAAGPELIDLFATNINRGRDHGLPDYMTLRAALGFDPTIPLDALLPQEVLDLYLSLGLEIDALVGIFAEIRPNTAYMGATGTALWALQFRSLESTAPTFDDAKAQADMETWLKGIDIGWVLNRDFGGDLGFGATSAFLASTVAIPLPGTGSLLALALGVAAVRARRAARTA